MSLLTQPPLGGVIYPISDALGQLLDVIAKLLDEPGRHTGIGDAAGQLQSELTHKSQVKSATAVDERAEGGSRV
jgi:hypothetical protein